MLGLRISPSLETNLKTTLVLAGMMALIATVGSLVAGAAGIYFSLAFSASITALTMWYSKELVMWLMGAKEIGVNGVDPTPEGFDLNAMVETLRQQPAINLSVKPTVCIIQDDKMLNAFATGRHQRHTAIAITTGLLKKAKEWAKGDMALASRWIEAIWCHELGHIVNSDIQTKTAASIMVGSVRLLSESIYHQRRNRQQGQNEERSWSRAIAEFALFYLVIPFTSTLLGLWLSRTREYAADDMAAKCGRANDLAQAFELLRDIPENHSDSPSLDALSSMMCLGLNPGHDQAIHTQLQDNNIGWLTWSWVKTKEMFSTHPALDARIARMQEAQAPQQQGTSTRNAASTARI